MLSVVRIAPLQAGLSKICIFMSRANHISLIASALLHFGIMAVLWGTGWVAKPWAPPTAAVNRGVITLMASMAEVDLNASVVDFHIHAVGVPRDHDHPDTLFAAHSHPPQKTSVQSGEARFEANLELADPVAATPPEQNPLPARTRSSLTESMPADPPPGTPPETLPGNLPRSTVIPRQAPRTPLASVPVAAVEVPRVASASAGAQVDQLPQRDVKNRVPAYPPQAYAQGLEGRVVLEVQLDETGRVTTLRVWQGSGYRPFDDSAVATVRTWRFTPARREGKAVPYTIRVPVRFAIRTE
jgi:protein TonB